MISKLAEKIWNETEGIISYKGPEGAPVETDYLMKLLTTDDALAERYNNGHAIRYTREWTAASHRLMEAELFILGLVTPTEKSSSRTYLLNMDEFYRDSKRFGNRQRMEDAARGITLRLADGVHFQHEFDLTATGREIVLDSLICRERMQRAEAEAKHKKLG
jgi:hypothetical protein